MGRSDVRAILGLPSVLVVDDDVLWLRTIQRLLRSMGVERVWLASGPDELAKLLDEAGDRLAGFVLLTDMEMNGDRGAGIGVIEMARRVGLPVAVVSACPPPPSDRPLSAVRFVEKCAVTDDVLYELLKALVRVPQAAPLRKLADEPAA